MVLKIAQKIVKNRTRSKKSSGAIWEIGVLTFMGTCPSMHIQTKRNNPHTKIKIMKIKFVFLLHKELNIGNVYFPFNMSNMLFLPLSESFPGLSVVLCKHICVIFFWIFPYYWLILYISTQLFVIHIFMLKIIGIILLSFLIFWNVCEVTINLLK